MLTLRSLTLCLGLLHATAQTFRAAFIPNPEFFAISNCSVGTTNADINDPTFSGFQVDLWRELVSSIGYSTTLFCYENYEAAYAELLSGNLDLISARNVDSMNTVVVDGYSLSSLPSLSISMPTVVNVMDCVAMIEHEEFSIFWFSDPLCDEGWFIWLAASFVVSFLIWSFERTLPESTDSFPQNLRPALSEIIYFAFTNLVPFFFRRTPRKMLSVISRIMFLAQVLWVYMVCAHYITALVLTVDKTHKMPLVSSSNELAGLTIATYSSNEDLLQMFTEDVLFSDDPDELNGYLRSGEAQLVCLEQRAAARFIQQYRSPTFRYYGSFDAAPLIMETTWNYFVPLSRGTELQVMNNGILRLTREGTVNDMMALFYQPITVQNEDTGITLLHVGGIFIIFIFGIVMAFLFLLGSYCYVRRKISKEKAKQTYRRLVTGSKELWPAKDYKKIEMNVTDYQLSIAVDFLSTYIRKESKRRKRLTELNLTPEEEKVVMTKICIGIDQVLLELARFERGLHSRLKRDLKDRSLSTMLVVPPGFPKAVRGHKSKEQAKLARTIEWRPEKGKPNRKQNVRRRGRRSSM